MIGVLGCGRMGAALIRALAATGRPVLAGTRDAAATTHRAPKLPGVAVVDHATLLRHAGLVVVAVPHDAALALLAGPGAPAGRNRVLVDASNPGLGTGYGPGAGRSSNGMALAVALPGWRVVKAFNTVSAAMLAHPVIAGRRVTVPIAGDDPESRREVGRLARALGFEPVEVGPIARAAQLEAVAELLYSISVEHELGGRIGLQMVVPDGRPAAG